MKRTEPSKIAYDVAVGMSCFILVSAVFSVVSYLTSQTDEWVSTALSGLDVALSCAAAILIIRGGSGKGMRFSEEKLEAGEALTLLPVFLGTFPVYYLLTEGSVKLFSLLGLETAGTVSVPETAEGRILYVLCAAVIPALTEELLFRGTLLRVLLPLGEGFAVGFSGLLFALSHWQPQRYLPVFFVSLVFSEAYLRTGSVLAPVILHLLNNLTVITGMWIREGAGAGAADVFSRILFALGAVSITAGLLFYRGRKPRAIRAEEECGHAGFFGTLAVWIMFFLYTAMMLQSLGL